MIGVRPHRTDADGDGVENFSTYSIVLRLLRETTNSFDISDKGL